MVKQLLTTSTVDLETLAEEYDIEMKVFSVLELKNKPLQSCIINADDEGLGGTHWLSVYAGPDQKYTIFFDPFGMPPDTRIIDFMKKGSKQSIAITTQSQSITASSCGYWCIYFLHSCETLVSPAHFLSRINASDQKANEKMLRSFFS